MSTDEMNALEYMMAESKTDWRTVPENGSVVNYHGSQEDAHGTYIVFAVPDDPNGRGYWLKWGDSRLSNVHRDSFTVVS